MEGDESAAGGTGKSRTARALKCALGRLDANRVDGAIFDFVRDSLLSKLPLPQWLIEATVAGRWAQGCEATAPAQQRRNGNGGAEGADVESDDEGAGGDADALCAGGVVSRGSKAFRLRRSVAKLCDARTIGNRLCMPD